jgi:uncharacterized short protein YbdD (DUF466 family)
MSSPRSLQNFLSGRRFPTLNNLEYLVYSLGNNYSNAGNLFNIRELINKIPYKRNWNMVNFTAPALFHGSKTFLSNGYPTKTTGTWFAKTPHQAILHAIARTRGGMPSYLYVYHFRTRHPKLINIKTSEEFNKLGLHLVRENRNNGWAFGNANFNMSKKLCEITPKIANGWHFPRDQSQVMLCNPRKFLKLYKVYKITGRAGVRSPNFRINYAANEAYWRRPKGLQYGLQPVEIRRRPRTAPRNNI